MHCGLKLHCLRALSRATVKTLLPRSNAVITRHWGLSHPLQIKPRTGNTQVIRGLLFCISARCQSLTVEKKKEKKKEKPWFSVWWIGEGGKQNASQKDQPEFWWTVINAWQVNLQNRKKNIHTVVCMCGPTYWHCGPPPWFSVGSLSLGSNNLSRSRELDHVLMFRAAVKHSAILHCSPQNRTGQHGLLHENLLKALHWEVDQRKVRQWPP